MTITDPTLPPEERKAMLLAVAHQMSPMSPHLWNEIASEWNQIVEQLGEPQVGLIDLPPRRPQPQSISPSSDTDRIDRIIRQAISGDT